jgi:hypothetical protein
MVRQNLKLRRAIPALQGSGARSWTMTDGKLSDIKHVTAPFVYGALTFKIVAVKELTAGVIVSAR